MVFYSFLASVVDDNNYNVYWPLNHRLITRLSAWSPAATCPLLVPSSPCRPVLLHTHYYLLQSIVHSLNYAVFLFFFIPHFVHANWIMSATLFMESTTTSAKTTIKMCRILGEGTCSRRVDVTTANRKLHYIDELSSSSSLTYTRSFAFEHVKLFFITTK